MKKKRLSLIQWDYLVFIAAIAAIVSIFLIANYHRINLEYIPFNGAFQAFNPVRRIFLGEIPGKDFNPYLGLGPTYLNFFLTYLLGKNFAASQFSIYFLSLTLHTVALFLLFSYVGFRWQKSLIFSSTMILGLSLVFEDFRWVNEIVGPGTSNLNFRSFLPFLTSFLLLITFKNYPKSIMTYLIIGSLMGIQVFWSNDYGIPSTFGLLFLLILYLVIEDKQAILRKILISLVSGIIAFYSVGMMLTTGNLDKWLKMNFQDIANDQFWYFLWFKNNNKILSLLDLPSHLLLTTFLSIFGLSLLIIILKGYCQDKLLNYLLLSYIGLTTLFAGLLSSLGGTLSVRYYLPSIVVSFFTISLAFYLIFRPIKIRFKVTFIPIILLFLYCLVPLIHLKQYSTLRTNFIRVEELGGWLSSRWQGSIEIASNLKEELKEKSPQQKILSTYSTGMDAIVGSVNSTNFDYIIHVLGDKNRNNYLEKFLKLQPKYITTLREDGYAWETWAKRTNWWFYREFINNYQVVESTFYNLLWSKRENTENNSYPPVSCTVSSLNNNLAQLTITTPREYGYSPNIYYVDIGLEYELKVNGFHRGLVNIIEEKTASPKAIGKEGNYSYGIPPGHQQWYIPVEHKIGTKSILQMKAYPEKYAFLAVKSCQANILALVDDAGLFKEVKILNFNDQQWTRGILEQTGVMIGDQKVLDQLYPGMELWFNGSGKRRIEKIENKQVFVNGSNLDSLRDGYPNSLKLILR